MSLFSTYQRRLRGKRPDQRGAALVEAAIIFVPLCLIVFGIIEYGFIFKDSLTLSSATRAGARTASAMPVEPEAQFSPYVESAVARAASAATFKQGDQMWIYKAKADGTPSGSCTGGYTDCIVYAYQTGGTWQQVGGSAWDTTKVNACLGGPTAGGNIDSVGIRLSLTHDAITGFFHGMNLHERTVMKFEPTKNCS